MSTDPEKGIAPVVSSDVELGSSQEHKSRSHDGEVHDDFHVPAVGQPFWQRLSNAGFELRGVEPVPVEKRTDTRYLNVFTIFGTSMTSLLPVGIGAVTTIGYGLSLRDASLMIVFLQFLFGLPAAYIITLGPLTGMRQMIQSRYCFGKYINILTTVITTLTIGGFAVTGSVNGAECLAYVRQGTLSVDGAIAIIMCSSMVISCLGYYVLHQFTRWAWIPTLFALVVLVGCAGDQLWQQTPQAASVESRQGYLGIVALLAGNMVSWGNVASDVACYMPPTAPRLRVALYCLLGISGPFSVLMVLGAAIGGAMPQIPAWADAYSTHGTGGVLGVILIARLGDFGRFILVILGMSVLATCARDIYSVSFNIICIVPWLRRVPRVVLAIVATGTIIGVAHRAAQDMVSAIITFLSIIGYYAGSSVTCFLIEFLYFRKGDPASFNPAIWDDGRKLPTGLSALVGVLVPWALIAPAMDQAWYTGPIAEKVGDLGFEFAVILSALVYPPVRALEIKIRGRL
ncbi:purine-cytosine permease fcy22 [Ophiostoma piceae UAMH 11346]|uniref:Purine-cytosine permease fcy22 n=1 Tax=Ophiostoma piceae (strain UAMH 11346) TaxID=1262450 RepID=S3C3C4_OPHP1|nr:purine-cytosine permease fcy22 [Ophiostoma piceae UAMH 11346]